MFRSITGLATLSGLTGTIRMVQTVRIFLYIPTNTYLLPYTPTLPY
jgi:hypothetical protein